MDNWGQGTSTPYVSRLYRRAVHISTEVDDGFRLNRDRLRACQRIASIVRSYLDETRGKKARWWEQKLVRRYGPIIVCMLLAVLVAVALTVARMIEDRHPPFDKKWEVPRVPFFTSPDGE